MKTITLTLTCLALLCSSALAFEGAQKENSRLPFHEKIDSSASDKANLESQMESFYEEDKADTVVAEEMTDEERIVSDFVDVEIHWGGKNKKVVDRRMNSVEPPVVFNN